MSITLNLYTNLGGFNQALNLMANLAAETAEVLARCVSPMSITRRTYALVP